MPIVCRWLDLGGWVMNERSFAAIFTTRPVEDGLWLMDWVRFEVDFHWCVA